VFTENGELPFRQFVILAGVAAAATVIGQSPSPTATAPLAPIAAARVTYHVEPLAPGELPKRFTPAQLGVLDKLNRRDLEHLARLTEIIVPDAWQPEGPEGELAYSPLPEEWPWAVSMPKALVVHQPGQVFGAYEFGKLVRWGPVSTGRQETPTPAGSFNLTWKSKSRRSTDNDAWLLKWYFNFINARGVSFHEFDLPGAAASHACVRLLTRDAMWLYDWGEQWVLSPDRRTVATPGTPVVIQGEVDFKNPTPWTSPEWWRMPLQLPPVPHSQPSAPLDRLQLEPHGLGVERRQVLRQDASEVIGQHLQFGAQRIENRKGIANRLAIAAVHHRPQ
jgi:hypothetical protein